MDVRKGAGSGENWAKHVKTAEISLEVAENRVESNSFSQALKLSHVIAYAYACITRHTEARV